MVSEHVVELTDANFEQEVVNAGKPALVDFWGDGCMPCKMLAPTIEDLAKDYAGRIVVGSVDTYDNRDLSMKFGISAIPTIILFKDGQMTKKFVGLQGKKDLKAAIDSLLE